MSSISLVEVPAMKLLNVAVSKMSDVNESEMSKLMVRKLGNYDEISLNLL